MPYVTANGDRTHFEVVGDGPAKTHFELLAWMKQLGLPV